ncbi:hypothetical protein [Kribbella sp. NPDC051718]|uniref:hypothetical protein n=1 Tax=Kribbella sp. NPDC051718 TaxID=3155168 RepID=UPI00343555F3
MTLQDIAELARVSRPVVSMWRRRPRVRGREIPFPLPVRTVGGLDHFDRDEIVAWLEETGRGNNVDVRQDAPAFAIPDDIALEDIVTLLCLHVLTGVELDGLSRAELVAAAESADTSDELLLREVLALGNTPPLLEYVADLIEASYGAADALARAESGRLKRETTERGLTDKLVALLEAVATAGRAYLGDEAIALVPPADHQLMRGLPEAFAGILLDEDDTAARPQRRRAVIDGVEVLREARGAVHVISVVGESDAAMLEAVDNLALSLGAADIGVVLGPAAVLCDPLIGDAEQRRSQTLRTGSLAMAVRLPRGLWKAAHRQSLALWILHGGRSAQSLRVADLAGVTIDFEDLASDVVAALQVTEDRAYRYARRADLAPVLAGGPVVPRGVRAIRLGTADATTHLDRVYTATLTTSEPLSGYDVTVAPAPGQVILRQRSLGELLGAGQIVMKRGNRISTVPTDASATVRIVSADRSTDGLRLDPFDAERQYPRANRTEPGDVVFVQQPRPMAQVDTEGGSLVASPSRILRLQQGAGIGPFALAALINEVVPQGSEWQTWNVPELAARESEALEAALTAAADHLEALRRHERALEDLTTSLIEGVAAGAVTIDSIITKRAG